MAAEYRKLGNTQFNVAEIRKMKKADFIKQYTGLLDGYDVEEAYHKITGKAKPVKEAES